MGTDPVSPSNMRHPVQIPSKQNLDTSLSIVQACRNERSQLVNGSLASKTHREQQLHLQRTQEQLRTEESFTASSSDSRVVNRLYVCPACDGNVEHTSFQTRSAVSRTTTEAVPQSLFDGSCDRTNPSPDSHSCHCSSLGINSYTNKNNTKNISTGSNNNSGRRTRSQHIRNGTMLCQGSDTFSATRGGMARSLCPWGYVLSLFWGLLIVANEHGGVMLAQARSTSTVPSTTTSRDNIRGFTPQQVDYPPELRPRVPQEPLHQYRIFLQRGVSTESTAPERVMISLISIVL